MKSVHGGNTTSGNKRMKWEADVTNIVPNGFGLLLDGQELFVDNGHFYWFRTASEADIRNVQRLGHDHLHWPALDIDLEVESIHHPEKYPLFARRD